MSLAILSFFKELWFFKDFPPREEYGVKWFKFDCSTIAIGTDSSDSYPISLFPILTQKSCHICDSDEK